MSTPNDDPTARPWPWSPEARDWRTGLDAAAAELEVELAEAQGDPALAVSTLVRHLRRGGLFVGTLPHRTAPLLQLHHLGDLAPDWVRHRWVLHQVTLSHSPLLRDLVDQAEAVSEDLSCSEDGERHWRDPNQDWVRRQLLAYDLGGARHFLDAVAGPALVDSVPDIEGWLQVPMGGYVRVGSGEGAVTWRDLATGQDHVTADVGAAHFVPPGGSAVGRLVPTSAGEMFESRPLDVPARTAQAVARRPDDWVAEVERAVDWPGVDDEPFDLEHDVSIVSDVPHLWEQIVVGGFGGPGPLPVSDSHQDVSTWIGAYVDAAAALARAALRGRLTDHLTWWSEEDDAIWPTVAKALLDPGPLAALCSDEPPFDRRELEQLAVLLPSPASALCERLLRRGAAA